MTSPGGTATVASPDLEPATWNLRNEHREAIVRPARRTRRTALPRVGAGGSSPDTPLVIGLHGRGSSMDDLAGLAPVLPAGWRYVFPQAPVRLDFGLYGAGWSWYEPIPATPEQMAEAGATLAAFLAATHDRSAPRRGAAR